MIMYSSPVLTHTSGLTSTLDHDLCCHSKSLWHTQSSGLYISYADLDCKTWAMTLAIGEGSFSIANLRNHGLLI